MNVFHVNFLCRPSSPGLSLGQTGFVRGTNPVKSGFHCVKQEENPGLSQVFTGFVPGTNPVKSPDAPGVVPRPTGQKNLCLCAFFLPDDFRLKFVLAKSRCCFARLLCEIFCAIVRQNRIAKSQPRWPQAGSQPFRCRNRGFCASPAAKRNRWPLAI